jgi:hypothetical protein
LKLERGITKIVDDQQRLIDCNGSNCHKEICLNYVLSMEPKLKETCVWGPSIGQKGITYIFNNNIGVLCSNKVLLDEQKRNKLSNGLSPI